MQATIVNDLNCKTDNMRFEVKLTMPDDLFDMIKSGKIKPTRFNIYYNPEFATLVCGRSFDFGDEWKTKVDPISVEKIQLLYSRIAAINTEYERLKSLPDDTTESFKYTSDKTESFKFRYTSDKTEIEFSPKFKAWYIEKYGDPTEVGVSDGGYDGGNEYKWKGNILMASNGLPVPGTIRSLKAKAQNYPEPKEWINVN